MPTRKVILICHAVNTGVDIQAYSVLGQQDEDSHSISGQSFGVRVTLVTSTQLM